MIGTKSPARVELLPWSGVQVYVKSDIKYLLRDGTLHSTSLHMLQLDEILGSNQ